MGEHFFWITSRAAGISALLASSAAVALGLLMAGRMIKNKDLRVWHEALSLATMISVAVHGLSLIGGSYLKPSLIDVLVWALAGAALLPLLLLGLYVLADRLGVKGADRLPDWTVRGLVLQWTVGGLVNLAGGLAMNDGSGNIVAYSGAYSDVTRLGGVISNGAGQVRIINGGAGSNIALDGSGTNTIGTLSNTSNDGVASVDIASGRVLRLGVEGMIVSPSTSTGAKVKKRWPV